MAKTKKDLKKVEKNLPAEVEIDFEEDAGAGQENMSTDDFAIPRIGILQAMSPQCTKADDGYIKGAEAGLLIDNVSNELIDGEVGIHIVPVSYRRTYIEWGLRENGGGFVQDHGNDSSVMNGCVNDEKNRAINKEGNQIVLTAEYFCYRVDIETGAYSPLVISMTSTQIKASKRWNTMMNQLQVPKKAGGSFNPAMFYRIYHLTTTPQSNNKGSWFGWEIDSAIDTITIDGGMDIYMAAKDFRIKIAAGEVKVSEPDATGDTVEGDDDPM